MANNYQNFTIPIETNPNSGWAGLNDNLQGLTTGIGEALSRQVAIPQQLQLAQAQEFAKAQADVWAKMQDPLAQALERARLAQGSYPMQLLNGSSGAVPSMADMLKGNPYARFVSTPSMGSVPTPLPSSSSGSQPMPAGQPSPTISYNPLNAGNPVNGGLAQETIKMSPYGTQLPPEYTNIPAVSAVKGAETFAGDMGKAKSEAQVGTSRDVQQLGMVTGALKNLVKNYNDLNSSGFAGDAYRGAAMSKMKFIPKEFQGMIPADAQNKSGQFIAARNELITKMQPLLSQQFGAAGSSRIMESLLHMAQVEIGDLGTPKAQFDGQVEGTIKSLYRIAKASQAYEQDLASSGQKPDENTAAQEIFNRMQAQKLSPEEENSMQSIINDTLGKQGEQKLTGQFQAPTAKAPTQQPATTLPSRDEIMAEIQRRQKAKAG